MRLEDAMENAYKPQYSHEGFIQAMVEWIVIDEQSFLVY